MTALASTDVTITLIPRDQQVVQGQKIVSLPTIAFGDGALTYPTGGVPLPAIGHFGFKRQLDRLLIQQPSGVGYTYRYDPDNHKIKILQLGETAFGEDEDAGLANTVAHAGSPGGNQIYMKYGPLGAADLAEAVLAAAYTVTHDATPDGNAIYMKHDAGGRPYLCCNMATDTADKVLDFTSYSVVITHDADAGTGGLQVYFDEDGVAGAQLLVNNSLSGEDSYIPTDDPAVWLKVLHDASAASNGVAMTYDDGTDERIEATFAGTADVDLTSLVYLDVTHGATGGQPYLCCNMANDAANKVLAFGTDHNVIITHDPAAATNGLAVYFDEDGDAGAQLLVNNTVTGDDAYVASNVPGVFLKMNHDASAASNGVAVSYDDATDEQLEATFAGTADVDLALSQLATAAGGQLAEIPATTAPAAVSLYAMVVGE